MVANVQSQRRRSPMHVTSACQQHPPALQPVCCMPVCIVACPVSQVQHIQHVLEQRSGGVQQGPVLLVRLGRDVNLRVAGLHKQTVSARVRIQHAQAPSCFY